MQATHPPNPCGNKDKPTQMWTESGGVQFRSTNQLLSSSLMRAHLLTSSSMVNAPPPPKTNLQSFGDSHLQVKKCFNGCMEFQRPMSMVLHILVGHQNVVGWWLVLIYMQTPPTHYYLESRGRAVYMGSRRNWDNQCRCQVRSSERQHSLGKQS